MLQTTMTSSFSSQSSLVEPVSEARKTGYLRRLQRKLLKPLLHTHRHKSECRHAQKQDCSGADSDNHDAVCRCGEFWDELEEALATSHMFARRTSYSRDSSMAGPESGLVYEGTVIAYINGIPHRYITGRVPTRPTTALKTSTRSQKQIYELEENSQASGFSGSSQSSFYIHHTSRYSTSSLASSVSGLYAISECGWKESLNLSYVQI